MTVIFEVKPHHAPVYDGPDRPYTYQYGVSDAYSGSQFQQNESKDQKGVVVLEVPIDLVVVVHGQPFVVRSSFFLVIHLSINLIKNENVSKLR